ncbi:RNA methyltransferase [Alicyclobacillus tolerans]|uniref:TrmH family RNA methyltransferase n=1 Tax=Alicyclobacillus tolerans TaxID=90970 RepID=UPI001F23CEBD|nr:RNA methyltransferase [Alicyclobacillus tolerans]MCF8567282.1 RNA methyltransferase [Alicyclobacillus tolerans]
MYIESPQNPRIREWSKLKTKKGRQLNGAFLVEGIRLTDELLRSSLTVDALVWDVGTDELPQALLDAAANRGVPFIEVSPQAFAQLADTVTPQGVIAIAKLPDALMESNGAPLLRYAVLLDGVQDPGNVGTLLRSADAFGISAVCAGSGTADPFSPKVVRASMGGLFRVQVQDSDSVKFVQSWKSLWPDGQVVVATADAATDCYRADLTKPTLLVIGGEAFGVSNEVAQLADIKVRIPMTGMADSLNAAVAGSVLLYETFRQRQQLSPEALA